MRKHTEDDYALETESFSPRSGVHRSILYKSISGGQWVCVVRVTNPCWKAEGFKTEAEKSALDAEER